MATPQDKGSGRQLRHAMPCGLFKLRYLRPRLVFILIPLCMTALPLAFITLVGKSPLLIEKSPLPVEKSSLLVQKASSPLQVENVAKVTTSTKANETPKVETTSPPEKITCQFAPQDPYHPTIMALFEKHPTLTCPGDLPDLVYLDEKTTSLIINKTKAELAKVTIEFCQYLHVVLGEKDTEVVTAFESDKFNDSIMILLNHDQIAITCYNGKVKVAQSYVARFFDNPNLQREREASYKKHVELNKPKETLSVLLVGVDGTSKQNVIRAMPETRKFILNNMDALEMNKFNKVGDNTFPNVVAMLTGISKKELMEEKKWTYKTPLDTIDHLMIWDKYKNAGYRIGFMLDEKQLTPFHVHEKYGWKNPPFDYYLRALQLKINYRENRNCIGAVPEVTFQLDYWHQLTSMFNNTKTTPYFAWSWFQRITHWDCNQATAVDGLYLKWFQEIKSRNVLNNTLLVFFSDHGPRFGDIRWSIPGMLETRTPMLFLMFPRWFQTKYPQLMEKVRTNQHRLTTMFDVHETLKDILNFQANTGHGTLQDRGISLFKEIPRERLCEHAGIPFEFCMCGEFSNVNVSAEMQTKLAETVLENIRLKSINHRNICSLLELEKTVNVMKIKGDSRCVKCEYYGVTVELRPGGGVFYATVQIENVLDKFNVTKVKGEIIRTSMYRGQADCLDNLELKSFCYCKNLL